MATNNKKKQPQQQRKRKMGDADLRDSPYFKIRALVSLLRPRFLQVLKTPDFQNCKAAREIEERMKLVMEYYRQMLTEGNKGDKIEKSPRQFAPAERKQARQFASAEKKQGRQKANHQAKQVTKETDDEKLSPPPINPKKTSEGDGRLYGSYIIGGSLTGWNFITFNNRKPPQYYGLTKEMHRSNRRKQ